MEVFSIADYERARQSHGQDDDMRMDSADDRLPVHPRPIHRDTPDPMAGFTLRFGHLAIDDASQPHRPFDCEPPSICRPWPGPRQSDVAIHKAIAKPLNLRKHLRPDDSKLSARPRKVPKPKKPPKKPCHHLEVPAAVASRNPPLHLLRLPPEIRNAIWTALALRHEPVETQLRRIRACKRLTGWRGSVIRRFPREPAAATVNHQLRREILSIFYGCNHFVFDRNVRNYLLEHRMLNVDTIRKWKPRPDVAACLSQVDFRFNALTRRCLSLSIIYALRRLPYGKVTIDVALEIIPSKEVAGALVTSWYCICAENKVVEESKRLGCGGDVTEIGMALIRQRNAFFRALSPEAENNALYPSQEVCKDCAKETLEVHFCGSCC